MVINISSQNLFPVRRDKQIAPSTGSISYGSSGGGGSVDSSIDLSGYIKEASINVGSFLSCDFVWSGDQIYINDFFRPPFGSGEYISNASLGSTFKWTAGYLDVSNYVSKSYVDGSLGAKTNLTLFNSSIGALTTRLNITDTSLSRLDASVKDTVSGLSVFIPEVSLNDTYFKWSGGLLEPSVAGEVTKSYVDGSLNLRVLKTLFDSSISSITTKNNNQDTSINNIWTKLGSVDTSLLNLGTKNANQDTSINGIWTKLGSVDTSLLNLGVKDAAQDTSINGIWTKLGSVDTSLTNLGTKNANQDTSISGIWTKLGSVDTSLTNLGTKDSNIDTSISVIWTKLGNIDTSVSLMAIKTHNHDTIYLKEASLNSSKFAWSAGLLEPSLAGGAGNVSNSGSPAITQLAVWVDSTHIKGDPSLAWDNTAGRLNVLGDVSVSGNFSFSSGGLLQFGDGADGDASLSSSTTLTREMYYNNLTVNASLYTAGFRIFVKGRLQLNKSIICSGGNGGNGSGSAAGSGGTAPYTTQRFEFQPIPSAGGAGASAGSGGLNNGAGGVGSSVALVFDQTNFPIQMFVGAGAGGGGNHASTATAGSPASPAFIFCGSVGKTGGPGSGTGSTSMGGGGGGAGGGCMVIYCNTLSGAGTFDVRGGNGGNGQLYLSSTYSGNGSGGNAGSASVFYRTQVSWSGTFLATGGSVGTGGNGGSAGGLGKTQLVAI